MLFFRRGFNFRKLLEHNSSLEDSPYSQVSCQTTPHQSFWSLGIFLFLRSPQNPVVIFDRNDSFLPFAENLRVDQQSFQATRWMDSLRSAPRSPTGFSGRKNVWAKKRKIDSPDEWRNSCPKINPNREIPVIGHRWRSEGERSIP